MIERIEHGGELLAIVVRDHKMQSTGLEFLTPCYCSQQVATMRYSVGHVIDAHIHQPTYREIRRTCEVVIVQAGTVRVDFFSSEKRLLTSRTLNRGDLVVLISGGHQFQAITDIELLEVKQGPYLGDDKERF
jgi:hypothetical protein